MERYACFCFSAPGGVRGGVGGGRGGGGGRGIRACCLPLNAHYSL